MFFFVSVLVFSPWLIKNYLWTGNPIYPLYDQWFNPTDHPKTSINAGFNHFIFRSVNYDESFWDIISIPIRIFFQGQDNNPQYFDGRLNPLLFFLPLFAFYRRDIPRLKIEKNAFLWFSIFYLLFVFVKTDMRIRYVSPIIPSLIILSMFGLNNIGRFVNSINKGVKRKFCIFTVGFAVATLLAQNFLYIAEQWTVVEPLAYITGRMSRDDYLGKHLKDYNTIRFANENLREDAVIISLFLANRSYYSERKILFNHGVFFDILKKASSPELICRHTADAGISHLIIRYDLFEKWVNTNYNQTNRRVLSEFMMNYLNLLFSYNGFGLFEIKTCEDA